MIQDWLGINSDTEKFYSRKRDTKLNGFLLQIYCRYPEITVFNLIFKIKQTHFKQKLKNKLRLKKTRLYFGLQSNTFR